MLGAAVTLLALQQPWNGKRVGAKRARRVLAAGGMLAITLYLWTAGLRSAGPLRTLLVDGAEIPLVYLFAVVSRRELPERRKTRGAIFMLLAYCLLIWDASGHVPDVREMEQSTLGRKAEAMVGKIASRTGVSGQWRAGEAGIPNDENGGGIDAEEFSRDELGGVDGPANRAGTRRRLLTTFRPPVKGSGGMKDALVEGTALRCEVGVMLVLVASVLLQCGRGFSRRLSTELGGAKRHFALATSAAWMWLTPLAAMSWASPSTGAVLSLQAIGGVSRMSMTWGHALGFVAVGFLWLVLPYYVRAVVSTALPQRTLVQSGVVVPFVMACVGSVVFGLGRRSGGVSWVLVMAFILECAGINLMMAGGVKRNLSELPIDGSGSTMSQAATEKSGGDGG